MTRLGYTKKMAKPSLLLKQEGGLAVIFATGSWTLGQTEALPALPDVSGGAEIILDGGGIETLDTTGAYRLMSMMDAAGVSPERIKLRGVTPSLLPVWNLVAKNYSQAHGITQKKTFGLLYQFGLGSISMLQHMAGVANFVGRLAMEMFRLAKKPGSFRLREFVAQMEAIFIYAIPISMAMIFLLGLVFAYLMGVQAQKFGANIYVVDGVSAAVLRELSPVIVAILVAGRTGAAITAQLGTMKVNEEIDALSILGLSPFAVLVLPRILALFIALPLLVFLGDLAGLLGGMVVAKTQLGLEYSQYWDRLDSVLKMKTFLAGVSKAPIFAIFIGLIACRMGITVARDARSVGEHTTSTVVQSIVAIIVLNAIFAIVFVHLGI